MEKQEQIPITTADALADAQKLWNNRLNQLLLGQQKITTQIAQQQPLQDITAAIARWSTNFLDTNCAVSIYNNDPATQQLQVLAAADIPEGYHQDMPPLTVDSTTCCFGCAAATQTVSIAADIATDSLWTGAWRDKALQYHLHACWAAPLITEEGKLQGVLAIYFNKKRTPGTEEIHLITLAMQLVQAAILSNQQKEIRVAEEQKTRKELEEALKVAEIGSWNMNLHTMQTSYSSLIRRWFGLTVNNAPLENILDCIHKDDRQRVRAAVMKAIKEQGIYEAEYRVISQESRQQRTIYVQGKVLQDEQGQPYLLSGVAKDVTLQRMTSQQLEQEVENRTVELKEANDYLLHANDHLQQFVYVASHDLQEPLRKIHFFSDILLNKHQLHLDNAGQQLLEKIAFAAKRMTSLIKGLLELSRLNNNDRAYVTVHLNNIIENIRNDFELDIAHKAASFEIMTLCSVQAVPVQMNQLFFNLIGNALKFSLKDRPPQIQISSHYLNGKEKITYPELDPQCEYCEVKVKDNGVGFDQQYATDIFEIFHRLHHREAYEGTGIGLALCKKIVENHNGKIFARSVPGEGTSFHIILPVKGLAKNC